MVGGPATTIGLNSALDTQCLRVTATAADRLSFDIRATAPNPAGAILQVTDASGAVVCGQFDVICRATGSTSYQLLVTAEGYQGNAITAHVDAWLVGTGSGFTSQCRAHQLSGATGWAPIRVKMSEAAVGYCAVLSVQANQETTIYSPNFTDTGVDQPAMVVESAAGWSSDQILCAGGDSYIACELPISTPPGKYVLLLYPAQLPLPAAIAFQGVCTLDCPGGLVHPVITSVQPATGPAGSINKLTIGGTDLNLGVQVDLASNGTVVAQAKPVSLSRCRRRRGPDRGRGGQDLQEQAGGVDGDVPLAAVDLLALSQPRLALGTVAAARTDCESITAAVGSVARPAAWRPPRLTRHPERS